MATAGDEASPPEPGLPPGMAMALATVTVVESEGRYARLVVEAPEFADLRPTGAVPVFKVFIPARPGRVPALPSFGAKYLPAWASEAERPTVRSYTAVEFSAAEARIEFLAFDPGAGSWWVE